MGAWTSYYKYPDWYTEGTPQGFAILAFKKQLISLGFGKNINPDSLQFGNFVRDRVKEFQTANGLEVDGVIGPKTSKALWKPLVLKAEEASNIPDNLVCKKTGLESGWDPAAVGVVDLRDRGLNQINSGAHPEVSDEQAFSPFFSLAWAAGYLADHYSVTKDWDAALAAYNVGLFYAKRWLQAGKPAEGVFTSSGKDIAIVCTRYVRLVRSQSC